MASWAWVLSVSGGSLARHIKAFETNPHASVIALCSSSRENAENVRQAHGLGPARVYTDYEQFLQDRRLMSSRSAR